MLGRRMHLKENLREHFGVRFLVRVIALLALAGVISSGGFFGSGLAGGVVHDRVISLRVIVNLDTFLKNESPEKLWLEDESYDDRVIEENSETLDIFEPGMKNLFDAGQIVIDAILGGKL